VRFGLSSLVLSRQGHDTDWESRRHLERKVKPGKSKPRLKEMENGTIVPAAWSILRWSVFCPLLRFRLDDTYVCLMLTPGVSRRARRTSRNCRVSRLSRVSVCTLSSFPLRSVSLL
jgi:hypothetical protein